MKTGRFRGHTISTTGGSTLNSIVLTDNLLGTITCPGSTLAPGTSMECTATGMAIAGQYENLGTVVAQPPGGLPSVTDDDLSHYFGAEPNMTITATTAGLDGRIILVGQTAAITYLVKNTGNVPLGNITVTDTAGIAVTCLKNTLNSGEEMTCNSSIVVTAGHHLSHCQCNRRSAPAYRRLVPVTQPAICACTVDCADE